MDLRKVPKAPANGENVRYKQFQWCRKMGKGEESIVSLKVHLYISILANTLPWGSTWYTLYNT